MVVSKLVTISANELDASLEEIDTISKIIKDNYEFIIIDEPMLSAELEQSLNQLVSRCTILLTNNNNASKEHDGLILRKPFLPRDLTALLLSNDTKKIEETIPARLSSEHGEILEQIMTLEPQKIRQILSGAKVTISIEFPKENQ